MELAQSRFRTLIRGKTRITLAWVFAALLIFLARRPPQLPGLALCFFGASIRFWASGYLRKDTRPAVGGPYAWVRNPLYLGTYLMALGVLWAIEQYPLLLAVTVLYATIYHFIILDEETKLREIFGPPYMKYTSLVPRFFPRPWPASSRALSEVNPEKSHHSYDWPLAMKNKAYEAYASWIGLSALLFLCAMAWQRLAR